MTKIVKAKYKISRRLGAGLWGNAKDPFNRRNYRPGQHGPTGMRKQPSDFGIQLAAKQKLKGYYAMQEKQFRSLYHEALRLKGDAGENLIGLLERRLSMVVYRLNLAPTIFAARQLISHKHILVNGKVLNISSYQVKPGDVIEVKQSSQQVALVLESVQKLEREIPDYMEFDAKKFQGKLTRIPKFADVPYPTIMEPSLVIEFYSR